MGTPYPVLISVIIGVTNIVPFSAPIWAPLISSGPDIDDRSDAVSLFPDFYPDSAAV